MGETESHSIFMLGYTGCHNTGSDVRILTIIEDIRRCFGESASITVGSFYPENTRRVIRENAGVKIERVPFVFPWKILQLTARHDITFLVEGSCFKQNWGACSSTCFSGARSARSSRGANAWLMRWTRANCRA